MTSSMFLIDSKRHLEDISVPLGQLMPVADYFNDLKTKFQFAAEQADIDSSTNEANYAYYHNRLKKKVNIQANNIGIIYETDIDFGDIENPPTTKCTPNNETYIKEHLNFPNLNADQKQASDIQRCFLALE
ncbi:hypothetical protein NPIL_81911 [Nephila pilipes]|uniref:Uncharacterized protein n=1 Tax=Nephila pilipes TaxID=299642 RepID=A0A8X6TKL0_NEPPI|nr:hypothetical protein NPIL_81911 [Nephila pilipes]